MKYLLLFLSTFLCFHVVAYSTEDTTVKQKDTYELNQLSAPQTRRFTVIDQQLNDWANRKGNAFNIAQETDLGPAFFNTYYGADAETTDARKLAQATFREIEELGHYTNELTSANLIQLPVGMRYGKGGYQITIGVQKAKFYKDYAALTVFAKIDLPEGKSLFLGADGIQFSFKGGLRGGNNKLYLLGDFPVGGNQGDNMAIVFKGGVNLETGDPENTTYLAWECGGVKELSIAGEVLFSRNCLIPLNEQYKPITDPSARVSASFHMVTDFPLNILVDISLPPFAIKDLDGVAFQVEHAVFDKSDIKNAPDIVFPANYKNRVAGNENIWKGVYIQEVKVVLPEWLRFENSNKRVTIEGKELLIDRLGITGSVSLNNILPLGTIASLPASVDKFYLNFEYNKLVAGGLEGYIANPLQEVKQGETPEKNGFKYSAVIDQEKALFHIQPAKKLEFSAWLATAQIDDNSSMAIEVKNGKWFFKAVFNGRMDINVKTSFDNKAPAVGALGGIEFQELTIQSKKPYISVGHFGYNTAGLQSALANFPISISNIGLKSTSSGETALDFKLGVNVMKNVIQGSSSLTLICKASNEGILKFIPQKVQIHDLALAARFEAFSFDGTAKFLTDHPVMGTGFSAALKLNLNLGAKSILIDAKGAWGSKNSKTDSAFRYWYIDVLASGFRAPLGSGVFLTGAGGGFAYHMRREAGLAVDTSATPLGISYVPDDNYFGGRLMAQLDMGGPQAMKAELCLEGTFNRNYGFTMGLFGKAYFLPSPELINKFNKVTEMKQAMADNLKQVCEKEKANPNAFQALRGSGVFDKMATAFYPNNEDESLTDNSKITLLFGVTYDFPAKTLHANLDIFMNVNNILTGIGPDGAAGKGILHLDFSKDDYYAYLGTPDNRIGVKMKAGPLVLNLDAYLMGGNRNIPGSPPPPPAVAAILGEDIQKLDYTRDLNALAASQGFTLGASCSYNTGDVNFMMFYGKFQAVLGFDVMMKRYDNVYCKGESNTIGINGWYANGQAYAAMEGELGVEVKLLGKNRRVPLYKTGKTAILLQAKLPNPYWFKGIIKKEFCVLNGLVCGTVKLPIEVGKKCELP